MVVYRRERRERGDDVKNHQAQLLSHLRLSGCKVGLLINFNFKVLKDGILRVVNDLLTLCVLCVLSGKQVPGF
ncbi:hypothetical protein ES705_08267 [subsurface metagenome]